MIQKFQGVTFSALFFSITFSCCQYKSGKRHVSTLDIDRNGFYTSPTK